MKTKLRKFGAWLMAAALAFAGAGAVQAADDEVSVKIGEIATPSSFANAFKGDTEGAEITFLKDVDVGANGYSSSVGKVVDFNGRSYTTTYTAGLGCNGGEWVFRDGKGAEGALITFSRRMIQVQDARVTVESGKYSVGTGNDDYLFSVFFPKKVNYHRDTELVITGGTFIGKLVTFDASRLYTYSIYEEDEQESYCNQAVRISGGTFSVEPDDTWIVPGCKKVKDAETGYWSVVPPVKVAKIVETGKEYETLEAALDAASAGDTVVLLSNVALEDAKKLLKSITIDFNGKTLLVKKGIATWTSGIVFKNGTLDVSEAVGDQFQNNAPQPTGVYLYNDSSLELRDVDLICRNSSIVSPIYVGLRAKFDVFDSDFALEHVENGICVGGYSVTTFSNSTVRVADFTPANSEWHRAFNSPDGANHQQLVLIDSTFAIEGGDRYGRDGILQIQDVVLDGSTVTIGHLQNRGITHCGTITLKNGAKINNSDLGERNIYATVVCETGCEISADSVANVQFKAGTVIKAGATVNVVNGVQFIGSGTIEKGANVTVGGNVESQSGATVAIADGKYNTLSGAGAFDLTGGVYKEKPADGHVNLFYEAVENDDETTKAEGYLWKIAHKPSVAEVISADGATTNEYPSLEQAFASVPWVERPADGKTVRLLADVDLACVEWMPVSFCGTFDGNGKTISNLKTGTLEMGTAGFFSGFRGNAKDVTFVNAEVVSGNYAGVFTAQVHNSGGGSDDNLVMTLENIKIVDSKVTGIQKCGGLIGFLTVSNGRLVVRGCTVDGLTFDGADPDGIWQAGGIVGYLQTQYAEDADFIGNTVKDITFVKDGNVEYFKTKYQHLYFSSPFIGSIENRSDRDRRHGKSGYGTVTLTGNKVEGTNTGYQIGPKSNAFIGDFFTTDEATGGKAVDVLKIDLDGEDVTLYVAQLAGAEKPCKTVAEAMADAKTGDTVNLIYMCDENVALKPGVAFKLNGKEYTGTVTSADDGYMAVYDAETGTWTVKMKIVEVIPAGESEGTKYTTLAEAFGAVQDGGTVKLLAACGDGSAVSVGGEKAFVFNLGGFVCTAEIEFAGGNAVISNGTVKGETPVTVKSAGRVVLVDSAKVVGNAAGINVRGGALDVTGGLVQSQTANAVLLGKDAAATIAGGTFIGAKDELAIKVEDAIEGDAATYPANFIAPQLDGDGNETGYPLCSSRIPADYVAFGYIAKDNQNGTWTVTAGAPEIKTDTKDVTVTPKTEGSPAPVTPEEAQQKAEEVKDDIVKAMKDPEIADLVGTGLKENVFTQDGQGNPILKDDVVLQLQKQAVQDKVNEIIEEKKAEGMTEDEARQYANEQKPDIETKVATAITKNSSSNTESHVEVKLETVEVAVSKESTETAVVEATLTKVTFEIKPIVTLVTKIDEVETTTTIELKDGEELANPVLVRLWLNADFIGTVAKVTHKHTKAPDEVASARVQTGVNEKGETRKYVEVSWQRFSEAIVEAEDTTGKACLANGKMFEKVADALSSTNDLPADATIELLADCAEMGLSLGGSRTLKLNGHAFTGSLAAVDGKEMVKTKSGEVFYAPEKIDVPVGTQGNGVPIRGFDFTGTDVADGTKDAKAAYLAGPSESGSGNLRWQDFVLFGNNPATAPKLIPQIVKAAPGFSTVQIKAQDGYAVSTPEKCGVGVKFQLMRCDTSATGTYVLVGEPKDEPVFTVDVKEIGAKTYWKIQTVFETTEDLPTQAPTSAN